MRIISLLIAVAITLRAVGETPATQPVPPGFIVGVWYQPVDSFATWKDRGVTTLVGFASENRFTREQWTAAARDAGLNYIIKPVEDDAASMKADATDVSLIGWEQPDEPDGGGNVPAEKIVANYKAWKAVNPKPILLNFDGARFQYSQAADYQKYTPGGDWIGFDNYIINRGDGPAGIPKLGTCLDTIKAWGGPKKKYFVFIECSDQDLRVTDWATSTQWGPAIGPKMRGPTPDEMKQEIDQAISHGASGIIYFPQKIGKGWEGFDGTQPDVAAAMKEINAKLTAGSAKESPRIKPALVTPSTQPTVREVLIDGVRYVPEK